MKVNIKSLLRNTKVLYLVFSIALINFFTFLINHKFDAIVLFLVVGVITRHFFSKNMIVILISAIMVTNILISCKGSVVEGLEMKKNTKNNKMAMMAANAAMAKKEGMMSKKNNKSKEQFESRLEAANVDEDENDVQNDQVFEDVMDGKKVPKVDYASTLESAYDNLDQLLGSDAIRSMSEDTQRLAEKQQKLMGNIQKLEPMMNKAGDMLKGLDMSRMGDMLKGLEGKMSMFGGGSGKKVMPFNPSEEE